MANTYALDETAAKEASSGGKRITDAGAYEGKLKFAWEEVNDNGTVSVNLIFESDSGQNAGPLAIYTFNGKGDELRGYKTVNAMIACMKLKGIRPQQGSVTLWDYDAKQEVQKTKDVFPGLVGPRIGLILTTEDYEKRDGNIGSRLNISAVYNPDTRQMANEVIDNTAAKALDGYIAWLDKSGKWHKPLANKPQQQSYGGRQIDEQFQDDDLNF